MTTDGRLAGSVVAWDSHRRYGAIWSAAVAGRRGARFFAHGDDLIDVLHLTIGQRVLFHAAQSDRGPRAEAVQLVADGLSLVEANR